MPEEVKEAKLQMIEAVSVNRRCETQECLRERWQQLPGQMRLGRDLGKTGRRSENVNTNHCL